MSDLNELYQQLIFDHSRNPKNFFQDLQAQYQQEAHNPLCGDQITLYVQTEKDHFKSLSFQGSGCAISMASASLLTEFFQGKHISEVEFIFNQFHQLVTGETQNIEELGKLKVLQGVSAFPARVKCATLAWHALKEITKKLSVSLQIKFSAAALTHIKKLLQEKESGSIFRLSVKKAGCSGYKYHPEILPAAKTDDIAIHCADFPIFIEASSKALLENCEVDLEKISLGQNRLIFKNPQASGACGCGESFYV